MTPISPSPGNPPAPALTVAAGPPPSRPNPKDLLGLTKAPLRLVPPALSILVAKVQELGAKKYGAYNWRGHPVRLTVYIEAAQRHLLAYLDGQDLDEESGLPHAAHAAACMGILLDAWFNEGLIDDRPLPGPGPALLARFDGRNEPCGCDENSTCMEHSRELDR